MSLLKIVVVGLVIVVFAKMVLNVVTLVDHFLQAARGVERSLSFLPVEILPLLVAAALSWYEFSSVGVAAGVLAVGLLAIFASYGAGLLFGWVLRKRQRARDRSSSK